MKGFLKTGEGVFQLAPKVTTVGREGCDLVVQSNGVDYQHAVIEFSSEESCFVVQDLNTAHGTYVNECRIQNAAVRLAPGDILRFGCSNALYELVVESQEQLACPPLNPRSSWGAPQPLTFLQDGVPSYGASNGLPQLGSGIKNPTMTWAQAPSTLAVPRPPGTTLRSRPLSAGNAGSRRITTITSEIQPAQQRAVIGSGWVSVGTQGVRCMAPSSALASSGDIMAMQEKEQKLLRMQEEVKRLNHYEQECSRKEDVIQNIREENADLQGRIRQLETSRGVIEVTGENDLVQKIMQLESELILKRTETASLKEQINRMRSNGHKITDMNGISKHEVNDRISEINSLRNELERVRKDKNITSGLVTQMQRDMTNKDSTISRLTREIEGLKTEVKEKDTQLLGMQTKMEVEFKRIEDNRKTEDEVDAKNKELMAAKLKVKTTELRLQDQDSIMASLKEELEKLRKAADTTKESQKHSQQEVEQLKTRCLDVERSERMVRVDLETVSKKLERFRQRVIQHTFSTPGIKAPDSEIDDDELLKTFKTIVDERTELYQQIKDMKSEVNSASTVKKEVAENTKKLKQQLNESLTRLHGRGQKASLVKQEIDMISCLTLDDSIATLRDDLIKVFQLQHRWQCDLEKALEHSGINVKVSDEAYSKHVLHLQRIGQELRTEKTSLQDRLASYEDKFQQELEAKMAAIREEMNAKSEDEVQRVKLQSEERFNRMIDEIKALEAEKMEYALQGSREKMVIMEAHMEQLKGTILEKEAENTEQQEVYQQLEVYRNLEIQLRDQIKVLESGSNEDVDRLKKELADHDMKLESHVHSYKEQIRQHSVTICTLEERLNKVVKKNKDYQAEIMQLKHAASAYLEEEAKSRPKSGIPSKPKVILQKPAADVVAIEATVTELRREASQLKKQVQEQQAVIAGLRKDLTGASARLTDVTGEMSEVQKQQIEKYRMEAKGKEAELIELRQQMCKLSEIIDKQKTEIRELNGEISKQKGCVNKLKTSQAHQVNEMKELQQELTLGQLTTQKQMEVVQEEGRITSELSAAGAQCRGERHEQVITRQREALTELRLRIRTLEQMHPQVPSHDQALQQVVLLKKELSELRTAQAGANTDLSSLVDPKVLSNQVSKARGFSNQERAAFDMERSAHQQTKESMELSETSAHGRRSQGRGRALPRSRSLPRSMSGSRPGSINSARKSDAAGMRKATTPTNHPKYQEQHGSALAGFPPPEQSSTPIAGGHYGDGLLEETVEMSETSYLTLLRALSSALELDSIGGLRSMIHIPHDERRRLAVEREQTCSVLAQRVNVMKERLARKDELLQGYETDLNKLRQAEMMAETKHSQIHSLSEDIRSRTEEAHYLRESLNRTREKLDQEKRLNSAIKHKKTFHLENEKPVDRQFRKPHCEFEDVPGKNAVKKKAQSEKLRRKNYEIKVLREELGNRDRHMPDSHHRMSSSLGLDMSDGAM